MLRFVRQLVNESILTDELSTLINNTIENTTLFIISVDNNNTNLTNGSSLVADASWSYNWHLILILALALIIPTILISVAVWYWYNRTHPRLGRKSSLPIAVNSFIEPTKIPEKRLSSSPKITFTNNHQPPPVPPRPTAYTTILGKIEYRSNL